MELMIMNYIFTSLQSQVSSLTLMLIGMDAQIPDVSCNIPKEYYWYKINKIRNFIKFHIECELFPKKHGKF